MSQPPPQPQQPEQPEMQDFGYGKHLLDQGPKGPTKESTQAKLRSPGIISIIVSAVYAGLLAAALGGIIVGFIASSAAIEAKKNKGSGIVVKGSGAKKKMLKQQVKEEKERRKLVYEYDRQVLFTGLGIGLVSLCIGLTTQIAGIVAGLNMIKLYKYSWAFWGLLIGGIPFTSICFLVMYLSEFIVGGELMMIIYLIVFAILDIIRIVLVFWGILALIGGTRRFFDVK